MSTIIRNQLSLEEHTRNHFLVRPVAGFTREDALTSANWVHVASLVKAMDRIAIFPEDQLWYGEFFVLKVGDMGAILVEISFSDLGVSIALDDNAESQAEAGVPDNYKVSWGGPKQLFRVMRVSDNKVLTSGLQKVEAIHWAINDAKSARVAA